MNYSCNYLYIISKYIVSILQIMNVVFADKYTNNLITTKCLNTAVMIIVLTLGDKKIPAIQYCDVSNTIHRHGLKQDDNLQIFNKMNRSIVRKMKERCKSVQIGKLTTLLTKIAMILKAKRSLTREELNWLTGSTPKSSTT